MSIRTFGIKTWQEQVQSKNSARAACKVVVRRINDALAARLKAGIIWEFEEGGESHVIPLSPSMQGFLTLTANLLQSGAANPHSGFLQTGIAKIRGPKGKALSDEAIAKLCVFAGMWGLRCSQIVLAETEKVMAMEVAELLDYKTEDIDWTVKWGEEYPEWSDNVTTHKP